MTEKLRVCGIKCLFCYDPNKPVDNGHSEIRCQLYASVFPELYKKPIPKFREGQPCRFSLITQLNSEIKAPNHEELADMVNQGQQNFKRKIKSEDVRAYVFATYVSERLRWDREEQRSAKYKDSEKIPLPCQVCLRKQKYDSCADRHNCHALDGDHAGLNAQNSDSRIRSPSQ